MNHLRTLVPDEALERSAVLIIRQSSLIQKEENEGSAKHQMTVVDFLKGAGWPEDRIETLDARGESGSRGERRTFREILRKVRSGQVGAVAFGRSDRLSRTVLESAELLNAAADHRTLIVTEGHVYRPASASDKMILGMMAVFAEYENNARKLWMMASRFALAKEGAYRVVLPTGLIAADPEDEEYLERLQAAGLESHLEGLEHHDAVSKHRGRKHYILPFPDREVYDACTMRMERMLATRDLDRVVAMINEDPNYPRPGLIPATKAVRRWHKGIEVNWVDVNHPNGRTVLRKWFKSPALYGTYQFSSPGLAAENPDASEDQYMVRIENAFPGFAPSIEESRVRKAVGRNEEKRSWKEGTYDGPRPHLLDTLRCGVRDENGDLCGNRLFAMYQPDGSYSYYSHLCRFEGHPTQYIRGAIIDQVVEARILDLLDHQRLAATMESLRVSATGARQRLHGLERELKEADRSMEGLSRAIVQAELDQEVDRKIHFNKQLDLVIRQRKSLETRLQGAQADLADFARLASTDRERILALGSDVRTLLSVAREQNPELVRAITGELLEAVRFDRVSGFACRVELVFPGGAVVEQAFMTRRMDASRAALEYAAGRLAQGRSAATIARLLNRARPKNHRVPWDEERVRTAPYALELQEIPSLREGRHQSVTALARMHGADPMDVFVAALHGDLGPGYFEKGEIHLRPTLEELHRRVPAAAKRHVARAMGWPIEETIRRSEASERTGLTRGGVVYQAEKRSGLGRDANGHHWVRSTDFS